ncbi:mechanosensitive ion channel family protein [Agaribacterium sp. ZY112]|uniref:mechanosensitive ion channel family protein n=1 Tax=Agaribacterium sp. ZY112 TaxID=3233574 RepID=UPI0035234132
MKLTFVVAFLLAVLNCSVYAEEQINLKTISDISENAEQIEQSLELERDDPGRSPLSAMLKLRAAAVEGDWEQASEYIDMRYLDKDVAALGGPELIRRLALVWSQQKIVDLSTISSEEEGHLDDDLPNYRDLLGVLEISNGEVPVYIQRIPYAEGGKVWRISNASLQKVPVLWDEFGYPPWVERLEQHLPAFQIWDMHNWQFVALVLLCVVLWFGLALLALPLKFVRIDELYREPYEYLVRYGFRYFLFLKLLQEGVSHLGLSLRAKVYVNPSVLHYLAMVMLGLVVIELAASIYIRKGDKNRFSVAVARPLATTLKFVFVFVLALVWLKAEGFNIGALLAGLGIGSLAVALAAQKTLENVFGAFTLYVARPIKPGDFCRFGTTLGVVEEIGLRSTLIRKLDRTLVYIPNSEFASKHVENYSSIDRRHYYRKLRLSLKAKPEQLRSLLASLTEMMKAHEQILDDDLRIRFEDISEDAYVVVLNAYINVVKIDEAKAITEDINLQILEVIAEHELDLALPERRILLEGETANIEV